MQRLFPHKHLPRPAESGQPPDGSEVQATSFEMDKVELSPSPCTTNFRLVRDLVKNRKQAANSRNGLHSYVLWSVSVRFNRHAVK